MTAMHHSTCLILISLLIGGCARVGFITPDERDASVEVASFDLGAPEQDGLQGSPDVAVDGPWRSLGGSASGMGVIGHAGNVTNNRLAISGAGDIYVAWTDLHLGARQVYVQAWRDDRWEGLAGSSQGPGISATAGNSRLGNVAVLPSGYPVVTWFDQGKTKRVMLRHFDGNSWSPLGNSVGADGISGNVNAWWPNLAIDGKGRVNVVWEQYWGSTGLRLRRFEGGSWNPVGISITPGISLGDGQSAQLVAHGDELHVLWRSQTMGELRYRRYDGTHWRAIEKPQKPQSPTHQPLARGSLALAPDGTPWIAAADSNDDVVLLRHDGAAWTHAAQLIPPMKTTAPKRLGLTVSTAAVFVTCRLEDDLGQNIYVFQLVNDHLIPFASPTPGGVSQASETDDPVVMIHGGRLYLSWLQKVGNSWTTYLRYLQL